jgi:hypothetical protein
MRSSKPAGSSIDVIEEQPAKAYPPRLVRLIVRPAGSSIDVIEEQPEKVDTPRLVRPAGSSIDRSIDVIERAASEGVITEAHTLERAQRRHVGVREGILKGILVHELSREPAHGGWRYGCVGRSRGVVLSIGLEDRDRLLRRPRGGPRSLLSSRFCSTCTLAAESTPVHVHVVCSAV